MPVVLIMSISCLTARIVGIDCAPRCIRTMPMTMSSSLPSPAMPSRGWLPMLIDATSLMSTGLPALVATSTFWIASIDWISPTPRTIAACAPKLIVCAPTLPSLLPIAARTCPTETPCASSRSSSIVTE